MLLEDLLQDLATVQVSGELQLEVHGLAYHSGQVSSGCLFAAIKGSNSDGHEFVNEAIDRVYVTARLYRAVRRSYRPRSTSGLPSPGYPIDSIIFPLTN